MTKTRVTIGGKTPDPKTSTGSKPKKTGRRSRDFLAGYLGVGADGDNPADGDSGSALPQEESGKFVPPAKPGHQNAQGVLESLAKTEDELLEAEEEVAEGEGSTNFFTIPAETQSDLQGTDELVALDRYLVSQHKDTVATQLQHILGQNSSRITFADGSTATISAIAVSADEEMTEIHTAAIEIDPVPAKEVMRLGCAQTMAVAQMSDAAQNSLRTAIIDEPTAKGVIGDMDTTYGSDAYTDGLKKLQATFRGRKRKGSKLSNHTRAVMHGMRSDQFKELFTNTFGIQRSPRHPVNTLNSLRQHIVHIALDLPDRDETHPVHGEVNKQFNAEVKELKPKVIRHGGKELGGTKPFETIAKTAGRIIGGWAGDAQTGHDVGEAFGGLADIAANIITTFLL